MHPSDFEARAWLFARDAVGTLLHRNMLVSQRMFLAGRHHKNPKQREKPSQLEIYYSVKTFSVSTRPFSRADVPRKNDANGGFLFVRLPGLVGGT